MIYPIAYVSMYFLFEHLVHCTPEKWLPIFYISIYVYTDLTEM